MKMTCETAEYYVKPAENTNGGGAAIHMTYSEAYRKGIEILKDAERCSGNDAGVLLVMLRDATGLTCTA